MITNATKTTVQINDVVLKTGLKDLKNCGHKGVLKPNFRPFSSELKKIRLFKINFDLGFRVL